MARGALERVGIVAVAVGVGIVGGLTGRSGWLNGDAAVYAASAWSGDVWERPAHAGYVALAAILARWAGPSLPTWLDGLSALAAATIVAAVGARSGTRAALVAAAVALPWSAFGEVDLPWIALASLARLGPPAVGAACAAAAVSVSPVAMLALPWVSVGRRDGWAVAGAAVAVAALVGVSGGGWILGERGVWTGAVLLPGRTLQAWALAMPWLALFLARGPWTAVLATLPLLLAPPDVPTGIVLGLAVAERVGDGDGRPARALAAALLVGQLAIGGALLARTRARVVEEHALVEQLAGELGPTDGLVAPWTWGARVSVAATRDPYGLVWRSEAKAVRDQAARWCAARPARVAVIEAGTARWEDGEGWSERFGCGAR